MRFLSFRYNADFRRSRLVHPCARHPFYWLFRSDLQLVKYISNACQGPITTIAFLSKLGKTQQYSKAAKHCELTEDLF